MHVRVEDDSKGEISTPIRLILLTDLVILASYRISSFFFYRGNKPLEVIEKIDLCVCFIKRKHLSNPLAFEFVTPLGSFVLSSKTKNETESIVVSIRQAIKQLIESSAEIASLFGILTKF